MIIRAKLDDEGRPLGFYPSDIEYKPEDLEGTVEITREQWQEFLAHQGRRRLVDGRMIECEPLPLPPMSSDDVAELNALAEQHLALRNVILNILHVWAQIEGKLSELLSEAAGIRDPIIASQIFFASNNSNTQLKMLDGVLSLLRQYHQLDSPSLFEFDAVLADWRAIRSRYSSLKEFRDAAAHRVISTVSMPDQGQHVVLSLPFQNLAGMLRAYESNNMLRFTSSEMRNATEKSGQLLTDLASLRERLRQHLQASGAGRP